jgi:two-component sensor histidine kinase
MELILVSQRAAKPHDDPELLLAESNHRIANSLALIAAAVRMRANDVVRTPRAISAEDMARELGEIAARIQAVGTLHRLLSEAPRDGEVNLSAYLREICAGAVSSPETRAQLVLKGVDEVCLVPAQDALHLALIVQELVTNAIKYAHPSGVPGRIEVSCGRDGTGTLHVVVADDGVGLPDGFDLRLDGDHGLRVARAMADQLGAKFEFESTPLGLACMIRVPPPKG